MYHYNLAKAPAIPLLSRVSRCPKTPKPSSTIHHRPTTTTQSQSEIRGYNHLPSISCWKTLICSNARRSRCVLAPKAATFSSVCNHRTRVLARSFHDGRPEPAGPRTGRKALPWIASDRDAKGAEKKGVARTPRSSWAESADSYFSRNGQKLARQSTDYIENDRKKPAAEESEDSASYFSRNGRRLTRESTDYIKKDRKATDEENEPADNYFPRKGQNFKRESTDYTKNVWKPAAVEEEDNQGNAEPVDDPRWNNIKSRYRGFVDRESRFEKPEVQRWNNQESWGRKTWKEASESSVPKMVGQGLYGVGPVLAALSVSRREFYALYVQEGLDLSGNNRKKKDKKGVEKVLRMAKEVGLKVVEASKHDLNMVVDNRPHQGLVLDASPLEIINVKELEAVPAERQRAPLWVALDEVTDPQNLGAIIRSAYFFGADGVIMCAKNSAPLSGVVSKASAGSLELIELRSCRNMMQFLSSSIENGWRVLGGSVSSRALPLSEVNAGVPTVLVLGSEGTGLRPLVERSCTQLIRIPGSVQMNGNVEDTEVEAEGVEQSCFGQELKTFLAVESLNVSVAAGVLLYHLTGNDGHLVGDAPQNSL